MYQLRIKNSPKIINLHCIYCTKPFRRLRANCKSAKTPKNCRPKRCITCCRKCSANLLRLEVHGSLS